MPGFSFKSTLPLKNIPLSKMVDAAKEVAGGRSKAVRLQVCIDLSAPRDGVEAVRRLLVSEDEGVSIEVEAFGDAACRVDGSATLVIIVANRSAVVSSLVAQAIVARIPAAVCALDPRAVYDLSQGTSFPLEPDDLVDMDVQHDYGGLSSALAEWIVDNCGDGRQAIAAAFPFVRRPLCHEHAKRTAAICGAVGAVPLIPGADMPVMLVLQARMILQMSQAYGNELSAVSALELAAAILAAFGGRAISRSLVKRLPKMAWAARGLTGYGVTLAMGEAYAAYFERGGLPENVAEAVSQARDAIESNPVGATVEHVLGLDGLGLGEEAVAGSGKGLLGRVRADRPGDGDNEVEFDDAAGDELDGESPAGFGAFASVAGSGGSSL